MTLIIDIPEDAIPRKVGNDHIEMWLSLCDGHVTQCDFGFTEIPDNATNGEVIKAMFDTTEEHFYDEDSMVDVYGLDRKDEPATFYVDWWNAPFRRRIRNGSDN